MIVSCPACSAKYRIDESKIKGRGAKITCPRCGHKFIIYKDAPTPPPPTRRSSAPKEHGDIHSRDFRKVGVTWRVRKTIGVTYSFHQLDALNQYMDQDQVDLRDSLSYDARTWVPLDSIDDLPAYFEDIWRLAERGELGAGRRGGSRQGDADDETEAPTTIMGHGHALMDDIRKAVAEATTPPPSPSRNSGPGRTSTPGLAARTRGRMSSSDTPRTSSTAVGRAGDDISEEPTTFSRRSPVAGSALTPSSSDIRTVRPQMAPAPQQPVSKTASPVPEPPSRAAEAEQSFGVDKDQLQLLITIVLALAAIVAVTVMAFMYAGILPGRGPDPAPAPPIRTYTPVPKTQPPTAPPEAVQPTEAGAPPGSDVDSGSETTAPARVNPSGIIPDAGQPAPPGSQ